MAGPTAPDQPAPASTINTSRVIPGLSSQPPPSSSSKRSRKKKTASKLDDSAKVPTLVDEPSAEVIEPPQISLASAPDPPNGISHPVPPVSASVSVSPVQQVQKRIRAATKKLQRISGYESSTVPLNEDQKRAIASKPSLEATIKELQDLLKILEDDEKLDALRIQAVREEEELKVKGRVDSAVAAEQKKTESNLTLLLQFLHLYSLVSAATRPIDSFAPSVISPVIQSATAQELAAVNALFHRLADGPIGGGDGSAFDSLSQFNEGSATDFIEGVTFGRIKEMVIQLTASPVELAPTTQALAPIEDVPQVEEETVQVPSTSFGSMMFLQQSEVLPTVVSSNAQDDAPPATLENLSSSALPDPLIEKESAVDHVARNKQLLEQATIVNSDSERLNAPDWSTAEQPSSQTQPDVPPAVNPDEWNTPAEHLSASQAEVVARTIDWAEDVQGQGEAPHPNSATNLASIPSHVSGDPAANQPPGPPRHHINNGRGNYRARGGYRGGPGIPRGGNPDGYRGGRGWYRGNPGFRGGRGGSPIPMDMNNPGGWRPGSGGPPEMSGGYRPRGDYVGGRYGGNRGAPRGGNAFHRPPPPPAQLYHPEVAAGTGGAVY